MKTKFNSTKPIETNLRFIIDTDGDTAEISQISGVLFVWKKMGLTNLQLSSKASIPEYPHTPTKLHGALELKQWSLDRVQSTFMFADHKSKQSRSSEKLIKQ
jgi:hypothetical protein